MGIKQIFRDIRNDWVQFLSIFLMSFMCLLIYSAIIGISEGMNQQANAFFNQSNLSDTIVSAKSITTEDVEAFEKIDGVKKVEARLVLSGELIAEQTVATAITLTLTATDDQSMNQPLVISGKAYDSKDGIWLNKELFDHYDLAEGSMVTIKINSQEVNVPIAGSIQQPEYLFFPESVDYPYPNYEKTAYGFISKSYLSKLMGTSLPNNQVTIQKKNNNFTWFQQESQKILGDRYYLATKTKDLPQISEFITRQEQIKRLAILFPVLFLLLSSLTMVSTMTRFIKKHQVAIGTYKALGCTDGEIYRYYTSVGLVISGIGTLLGISCGPTLLAPILINYLKKQYSIPVWEITTEPSVWLVAVLLIGCCITMAYLPCRKILKQVPANVLRIQMTHQVKPGWLERRKILEKLSFTNHWIVRGILRNKSRSLMGIFGAFGCTILLVTGIGINKSIEYTVDRTYKEVNKYEEKVTFNEPLTQENQELVSIMMASEEYQWLYQQKIDIISENGTVERTVTVLDHDQLLNIIEQDKQKLQINTLSANEVFLSHKLARTLGIKAGDTIYLKLKREIVFQAYQVQAIVDIAMPQGVIMNKTVWENMGYEYQPTTLLSKDALNSEERTETNDLSFVKEIRTTASEYNETLKMMQSIKTIISVILFAAIFLGIVILFNFNLLIFSERFREFATLKVLGFKQSEIRSLLVKENLFLTIVGLGFGFIGGHFFLKAYINIISPNNQEYIQKFGLKEYALVAGITLLCSIIVNLFLDMTIRRISMAESLKSNE